MKTVGATGLGRFVGVSMDVRNKLALRTNKLALRTKLRKNGRGIFARVGVAYSHSVAYSCKKLRCVQGYGIRTRLRNLNCSRLRNLNT